MHTTVAMVRSGGPDQDDEGRGRFLKIKEHIHLGQTRYPPCSTWINIYFNHTELYETRSKYVLDHGSSYVYALKLRIKVIYFLRMEVHGSTFSQ